MTNIYTLTEKEALKKITRMNSADIERHIKKGVQIYTVADYIEMLEGNDLLEDELEAKDMTVEEYAKMLKAGYEADGIESGTCEGMDYVIEYCL